MVSVTKKKNFFFTRKKKKSHQTKPNSEHFSDLPISLFPSASFFIITNTSTFHCHSSAH